LAHGILGFYFWQQVLYIQQYILDEAWGSKQGAWFWSVHMKPMAFTQKRVFLLSNSAVDSCPYYYVAGWIHINKNNTLGKNNTLDKKSTLFIILTTTIRKHAMQRAE
jgi:hypothetical protein